MESIMRTIKPYALTLVGALTLGLLAPQQLVADEMHCATASSGAESQLTNGSIANIGQTVIGRTTGGGIQLHAGVIACLSAAPATFLLGDMNCDGAVNLQDINPFTLALANPVAYATAFPDCDLMNGDINDDGAVDLGDINPFVQLLAGP
jgi:hypothetical protein